MGRPRANTRRGRRRRHRRPRPDIRRDVHARRPGPAARVEKAVIDISRALTAVYIPTGDGWAAALAGGHVTWTPLPLLLAAP
jgi:hypothetical protein